MLIPAAVSGLRSRMGVLRVVSLLHWVLTILVITVVLVIPVRLASMSVMICIHLGIRLDRTVSISSILVMVLIPPLLVTSRLLLVLVLGIGLVIVTCYFSFGSVGGSARWNGGL